jgi:co-chaperonin GroES (HSP10)
MEIIPLNKKVLLKPIEDQKETKTSGGILLAEEREIEANQGEVVSLGEKVELKIKAGERVIYDDMGSEKVGELVIVDETRIIAKIR